MRRLPDATRELCDASDAILFGSVGLPQYDGKPLPERPEYALFLLRRDYELYANLRPVRVFAGLEDASPLKPELVRGLDLLVVRELTGGIYYGRPKEQRTVDGIEEAVDTMIYRAPEIERIARIAFELARARRKRLTSVDKQNILETSRLWRRVVNALAREYPDVRLEHLLVDNAAMQLVARPGDFDVIVTENMFGDILSDEAAILTGSIGTLPSASLGAQRLAGRQFGLYEPIGGTAPDVRRQRTSPIRPPRFSRRRCCCATRSTTRRMPRASNAPSSAPTPTGCAPPSSPRTGRRPLNRCVRRRRYRAAVSTSEAAHTVVDFARDVAADEVDEAYVEHGVRARMRGDPSGAPSSEGVAFERGDGVVVGVRCSAEDRG